MAVTQVRETATVTIANGASLSDAADLNGLRPVAIRMPTGWTAASITFQGSDDGTTFQDVYDDGAEVVVSSAAASRNIGLPANVQVALAAWEHVKVRSGTGATPVAQGAERSIKLVLMPA